MDKSKRRMDLISVPALKAVADVMTKGAEKHGERNWEKNDYEWSLFYAAAMRHLMDWYEGKDVDPEWGYPHLAHAMCNLMILLDLTLKGGGTDDRPSKQPTLEDIQERLKQNLDKYKNVKAKGQEGIAKDMQENPTYTWTDTSYYYYI